MYFRTQDFMEAMKKEALLRVAEMVPFKTGHWLDRLASGIDREKLQ